MKGMKEAGIIRSYTMWPKIGLIRLFEENPTSKVVVYDRHPNQTLGYNKEGIPIGTAAPFNWFQGWCYSNMTRYASVVVKVDPLTNRGVSIFRPNPEPRSAVRNLINKPGFYVPIALGTGLVAWKTGTIGVRRLIKLFA